MRWMEIWRAKQQKYSKKNTNLPKQTTTKLNKTKPLQGKISDEGRYQGYIENE